MSAKYPEHEKLAKVKDASQAQGDFVEWLRSKGIVLAEYHKHTDDCFEEGARKLNDRWATCGASSTWPIPVHTPITRLLAEYHGIDEAKLEKEKRAMLEALQARR